MSVLKLRSWDPESEVMTAGHDLNTLLMTTDKEFVDNFKGVWLRWTGFIDSQGREIYEGDILKFDLSGMGEDYGIVRFSKDGFWTSQKEGQTEELLAEELREIKHVDIIGDIYRNPDIAATI